MAGFGGFPPHAPNPPNMDAPHGNFHPMAAQHQFAGHGPMPGMEALPIFEGLVLTPLGSEDGGKSKWTKAHRERMMKPQAELKEMVRVEASKGKQVQDIINGRDVSGIKRSHIDRVVTEYNLAERNPACEWRPCSVKLSTRPLSQGILSTLTRPRFETTKMQIILEKVPRVDHVRLQATRHESFSHTPLAGVSDVNVPLNLHNIPHRPPLFQERPDHFGAGGHPEGPRDHMPQMRPMPGAGHSMHEREHQVHGEHLHMPERPGAAGAIPVPPPVTHLHHGPAKFDARDDLAAIVDTEDESEDFVPEKRDKRDKHKKQRPPIIIPARHERSRGRGNRSPASPRSDFSDSLDDAESAFESPPSSVSREHETIFIKPSGGHGQRKSSFHHERKQHEYHQREHRRRSPVPRARRKSSLSSNEGYVIVPTRKERHDDYVYKDELRRERQVIDNQREAEDRRVADQREMDRRREHDHQLEVAHLKGKLEGMRYSRLEMAERHDRLDYHDGGYAAMGRYDGARERLPPLHRAITDRPYSYVPHTPRRRDYTEWP